MNKSLNPKIEIGQKAPLFILPDTMKQPVSLAGQQGHNVLLLFFPFAFTGVCTAELCSVRDQLKSWEQLDARPFGISVDSPYSLARYKEEHDLNFPLLSDFNKEVSEAYGCLYESFRPGLKGVSKRSAFLIDRKGIVQYAEVLDNAGLQPDFEAVRGKLRELSR